MYASPESIPKSIQNKVSLIILIATKNKFIHNKIIRTIAKIFLTLEIDLIFFFLTIIIYLTLNQFKTIASYINKVNYIIFMTKKQNFLLLSLDDKKTKKIANAVNNSSGVKILNYLINVDCATESEISEELDIAISTIHYNLEQLQLAGLVDWEDAHFSKKGKKVKHYKLISKYIIIAPKEEKEGFLDKLKTLFPAFLISIFGSFLIYYFSNIKNSAIEVAPTMAKSAIYEARDMAADTTMATREVIIQSTPFYTQLGFVFFAGSLFALLLVLIWSYIRKK